MPPFLRELSLLEGPQKNISKEKLQVIAINYGEKQKLVKKLTQLFKRTVYSYSRCTTPVVERLNGLLAQLNEGSVP